MSAPALLLAADLAADPGLPALRDALRIRGAVCGPVAGAVTPRTLLAALRALDGDPARSWLACRDPGLADVAGTAGLYGIVVVGTGEARDAGVLVRYSTEIAAIPLAMVPRGGGCWHAV